MKKILTVLLALSVVFTYTVGTAFAADYDVTNAAKAKAEEQQELLADTVKAAKDQLYYNAAGYLGNINGVPVPEAVKDMISRTAAEQVIDDLAKIQSEAIYDKAMELAKDGTFSEDDAKAVEAVRTYADAETMLKAAFGSEYGSNASGYNTALYNQFVIDKTAAEETINNTVISGYSDIEYFYLKDGVLTELPYDERPYTDGISEAELVKKTKEKASEAVSAVTLNKGADTTTAVAAIKAVNEALEILFNPAEVDNGSAYLEKYADDGHQKFMTSAERESELEKYKKEIISDLNASANDFEEAATEYLLKQIDKATSQTELNKAKERLNSLSGNIDALISSYTDRINDADIDEYTTPKEAYAAIGAVKAEYEKAFVEQDAAEGNFDDYDDAVDNLAGIEELKAYAKEYAEVLKNTYDDANNQLKYDAEAIDIVLDAALDKIQAGLLTNKAAVKEWMNRYADTIAKRNVILAQTRMDTLNAISAQYPESDYDDPAYATLERWEAMSKIIEKAKSDINAATTPKEIRNIKNQLDKDLAGYLTDAECKAIVESDKVEKAYNAEKPANFLGNKNAADTVSEDVDAFFIGKTGYRDETKTALKAKIKSELKVAVCSVGKTEAQLKTADIISAMRSAYNKVFNTESAKVKTDEEMKAAEQAVIILINAIDTPVSLDSREKIEAAQEAYAAYLDMPGADKSKITNSDVFDKAAERLKQLEKIEVLTAISKLADKDITVEDKAALEAVIAMNNTYVANWNENPYGEKIAELYKEYVKAVSKDFIDKASALPTVIKTTDKAAIDAAQAAYDELVAVLVADGYTEEYIEVALDHGYGLGDTLVDQFLKSKIKFVDSKEQYERAIITEVQSLKLIKNHSEAGRTNGKSWIKIMWSTVGDDSIVDGYQVYKSTKANSGYKYTFTSKAKWYKNTAGLKKGTRYYYKVRAFVEVDGQKYYSDWSNKAYRYAK